MEDGGIGASWHRCISDGELELSNYQAASFGREYTCVVSYKSVCQTSSIYLGNAIAPAQ